ncbi:MAG TPA: hypothetical protein VF844_12560, partial [Ktedonobacteraceae bacterium]
MLASAPDNNEIVGQIVDTPSALEFMREALEKITEEELTAIVAELRYKSQRFRQLFAQETLPMLDDAEFRSLLRSIFSTRRSVTRIMEQVNVVTFRDAL